MKRQSTTAKITNAHAQRIGAECSLPCSGVIVRRQGVEYGVTQVIKTTRGYAAHTYEGVIIALSACTVRKTTIDMLPHIAPQMTASEIVAEVARMGGEVTISRDSYMGDLRICDEGDVLLTSNADDDMFDTIDVQEYVFNRFA